MKTGSQTIKLTNTPKIYEVSNAVGPKEANGPLGVYFDIKCSDVLYGEKTFEKAESKFITSAINNLFVKLNMTDDNVDYIFGGDLLNQCIATAYAVRELNIPFFGLYGACSTFIESIILASLLVDAGFAKKNLAVASSHFCSAERQFRFPLEHRKSKNSNVTKYCNWGWSSINN